VDGRGAKVTLEREGRVKDVEVLRMDDRLDAEMEEELDAGSESTEAEREDREDSGVTDKTSGIFSTTTAAAIS